MRYLLPIILALVSGFLLIIILRPTPVCDKYARGKCYHYPR